MMSPATSQLPASRRTDRPDRAPAERSLVGLVSALAISLLLAAPASPALAQDEVPQGGVQQSTHTINLQPGATFEFDVPLWRTGTQVTVAFTPARQFRPVTIQPRPIQPRPMQRQRPRSLDTIERSIESGAARQEQEASAFSFEMRVGTRTMTPDPELSGLRTFVVTVGILPRGAPTSARGTLRNVSDQPQSGELRVQSVDASAMNRLTAERQRAAIQETIEASDPDLIFIINHTLQRHLAGYPGGKSEVETQLSEMFAEAGVSNAFVRSVTQSMQPFEAQIQANVRNPQLRTLSTRQPVSMPIVQTVRQVRPAQVEPGQLQFAPTLGEVEPPEPTPQDSLQLFRIYLAAIKSHRCADDAGWEWGCDEEEPYVVWSADSPDYMRRGVTDKAGNMVRNSERFLTGYTNVFSVSEGSPEHRRPTYPLIYMYQVIESDPGGPSTEDLMEAIGAGVTTTLAFYLGDFPAMIASGIEMLKQTTDYFVKLAARGDDLYPIMIAVFDEGRLLLLTSGDSPGPLDANLFESAGDYNKFAIRVPVVKKGGNDQWSLVYIISREAVPPPDVAMGTLCSFQAMQGAYYIRHRSFRGEVTPVGSALDRQDATFRMVPGLADSDWVSLESVNYPGHYLRHQNFEFHLQQASDDQLFKEDATFRIVPGLANADYVTLESYNYPGHYIYWSSDWKLRLGDFFYDMPDYMKWQPAAQMQWRQVATFRLVDPLTQQ
ncbi:MAG: AbfB domain-containing protein [Gemmatimonadales bacterium]